MIFLERERNASRRVNKTSSFNLHPVRVKQTSRSTNSPPTWPLPQHNVEPTAKDHYQGMCSYQRVANRCNFLYKVGIPKI